MANQIDSIEKIDKALVSLNNNLKDIREQIVGISKDARGVSMAFDKVKTPKDLSSEIKKTSENTEQLTALLKEQDKVEKNLISTIAKKEIATESTNRALIKERFELQQQNKLIKEATVISSRYSTLLQKTTAQRNKLARTIQDLNLKRELGNKLSDKEQKELRQSTKQFEKYDKAVKKAKNSVGRFQENVGNYPKILSSIKNVTTGLIGAFGAIEGLRLGVDFAKDAVRVAREAKGVEFAFKRLGIEGVQAFENIKKSTRGTLSDLDIKKSLNEFDNFNISLKQTDVLFEFLAVRAAQTGKSVDSLRDSLVEGLAKESKLRIDNLGISVKDLNEELEKAPDFVTAVANIAKTEIAEAGNILDEAASSQEKFNAAFENFKVSAGSGFIGKLTNEVYGLGTAFLTVFSEVNDASDGFVDFATNLFRVSQGQAALVAGDAAISRELKKRKPLVEEIIKLQKEQGLTDTQLIAKKSILNKTNSRELQILLDSLKPKEEDVKITKKSIDAINERNKAVAMSINLTKGLNDLFNGEASFKLPEINQDSIDKFQEQLSKVIFSDKTTQEAQDRLRDSVSSFFGALNSSFGINADVFDTFFDRLTEKGEKSFEELADIASSSFDVIGEVGNALFDSRIQKYDDEIERNNEFYASLLENEELSEGERERLEIDRKNKEKKIREDQRKEEKKAFLFNQALAIAQVGIDLAKTISAINLAAAAQDAITPFAFGATGAAYRAANIPLAITSAALQTGVILAKALPAFAEGGEMTHDGLMMINDHKSGRLEVVERDGKLLMTNEKNAIVEGKKGDIIHKDAKEYFNNLSDGDILKNTERHAIMATLQNQNYLINKLDNKRVVDAQKVNTDRIIKAIKGQKTKFNVHQNISLADDLRHLERIKNSSW